MMRLRTEVVCFYYRIQGRCRRNGSQAKVEPFSRAWAESCQSCSGQDTLTPEPKEREKVWVKLQGEPEV